MISDHDRAAHLARQLARVAEKVGPSPGPRDTRVGDGHGRKGQALALLFHVSLRQKKSDSQPMRRPVTLPKVPVAARREVPSERPARFR